MNRFRWLRFFGVVAAVLLMLSTLPSSAGHAQEPASYVVRLSPGVNPADIAARYDLVLADSVPALSMYLMQSHSDDALDLLAADSQVLTVELDTKLVTFEAQQQEFRAAAYDTDALRRYFSGGSGDEFEDDKIAEDYGKCQKDLLKLVEKLEKGDDKKKEEARIWPLEITKIEKVHKYFTGAGVTVAVLDTGVDLDHPDLADKLLPGYDFVENDNVPDDVANGLDEDGDGLVDEGTGHGTHVSGVIAFTAPNAKILPLRVLNSDGTGELFDLVKGVIYAVDNGADVMNFSLSAHIDAPTFAAAVQYAIDQGVVVVAAGASDDEGMHFPASYPGVLSVGASNYCDLPAKFSLDSVAEVDIFAPGDFIFSTTSQAQHAWWSGTSMATPFVAGEAALLLEPGTCPSTCVLNFIQDESKDLKFKMKGKDGKDFKPRRIEGEKAAKKVKKLKVKYIGGEIGAAGSTMYVISEVFLPITPR